MLPHSRARLCQGGQQQPPREAGVEEAVSAGTVPPC